MVVVVGEVLILGRIGCGRDLEEVRLLLLLLLLVPMEVECMVVVELEEVLRDVGMGVGRVDVLLMLEEEEDMMERSPLQAVSFRLIEPERCCEKERSPLVLV